MKKSLTLIEVLIAAAILTMVLVGTILAFTRCIMLNEHNRNLTIATMHAQYVMEDIKNTNFNLILDSINNGDWNWGDAEIGAVGLSPLSNEIITITVSGTDLLDITINVSWKDMEGRASPANIGFQTFLASP